MRIAVIGNGNMAVSCLGIMRQYAEVELVGVLVKPEDNESKVLMGACENWSLPVIAYRSLRDPHIIQQIMSLRADILFNINVRRLIPVEVVTAPRQGTINFHNSPLPRYRGLNVCSWAIINGEKDYGVTWHYIDAEKGIDSGDILAQRFFDIAEDETAYSLIAKCVNEGIELFEELFPDIVYDALLPMPQEISGDELYLGKQTPNNGMISEEHSVTSVQRLIRALTFYPISNDFVRARVLRDDRYFYVDRCRAINGPEDLAEGEYLFNCVDGQVALVLSGDEIDATHD